MPFVTRHYLDRLDRDLLQALQRAEKAEQALADERRRTDSVIANERQAKDFLTLQLASRVVTKNGGYALEVEPKSSEPTPHPKGYAREPNDQDLARLEHYKRCYLEAGKSEDEAEAIWEAEMRGENVTYPYEQEEAVN